MVDYICADICIDALKQINEKFQVVMIDSCILGKKNWSDYAIHLTVRLILLPPQTLCQFSQIVYNS